MVLERDARRRRGRLLYSGAMQITVMEPFHSVFYAPHYVALHLGHFKAEGFDVTTRTGASSAGTTRALIEGSAQISLGGLMRSLDIADRRGRLLPHFAEVNSRNGFFLSGLHPRRLSQPALDRDARRQGRRRGDRAVVRRYPASGVRARGRTLSRPGNVGARPAAAPAGLRISRRHPARWRLYPTPPPLSGPRRHRARRARDADVEGQLAD